jgi:hypothetical protein
VAPAAKFETHLVYDKVLSEVHNPYAIFEFHYRSKGQTCSFCKLLTSLTPTRAEWLEIEGYIPLEAAAPAASTSASRSTATASASPMPATVEDLQAEVQRLRAQLAANQPIKQEEPPAKRPKPELFDVDRPPRKKAKREVIDISDSD